MQDSTSAKTYFSGQVLLLHFLLYEGRRVGVRGGEGIVLGKSKATTNFTIKGLQTDVTMNVIHINKFLFVIKG